MTRMSALGRKRTLGSGSRIEAAGCARQLSRAYSVITFADSDSIRIVLSVGEPCWIRTSDLLIKSQLLYRLS